MATLGSWLLFGSFMYVVGTFGQILLGQDTNHTKLS